VAGSGAVYTLLRVVRDWKSRRRLGTAAADDLEDQVRARKVLRQHIVDRIASGELPIRQAWADDLLTQDVARAFNALGQGDIQIS
jgi:hypothetical protein